MMRNPVGVNGIDPVRQRSRKNRLIPKNRSVILWTLFAGLDVADFADRLWPYMRRDYQSHRHFHYNFLQLSAC